MTLQPTANREDVLTRTTPTRSSDFAYSAADHTSTSTTGNGSISYGRKGVNVNPGSTVGDEAKVNVGTMDNLKTDVKHVAEMVVTFDAIPSDDIEVGRIYQGERAGVEDERGAYWNVTDGVFRVGSTTEPGPTVSSTSDSVFLRIIMDEPNGVTHFQMTGGIQTEVTVNDVDRDRECIIRSHSQGNSNNVVGHWYRQFVTPNL